MSFNSDNLRRLGAGVNRCSPAGGRDNVSSRLVAAVSCSLFSRLLSSYEETSVASIVPLRTCRSNPLRVSCPDRKHMPTGCIAKPHPGVTLRRVTPLASLTWSEGISSYSVNISPLGTSSTNSSREPVGRRIPWARGRCSGSGKFCTRCAEEALTFRAASAVANSSGDRRPMTLGAGSTQAGRGSSSMGGVVSGAAAASCATKA